MQVKTMVLAAALSVAPGILHAQFEFKLDGRNIQVHSFASEGFSYTNQNNYLTMDTSSGSFAMTDMGANVSTQVTDHLRVGAQFYTRNLGKLGNWAPTLDWAVVDYRVKDWLGFRAGKVKTVAGLYNDTQDMEFLQTWALMPQALYPLDQRGMMIAHIGGDMYGTVSVKKLGQLSYTAYGGKLPQDPEGWYVYGLTTSSQVGTTQVPVPTRAVDNTSGTVYGADVRWATPVKGLTVGSSALAQAITVNGSFLHNQGPFKITPIKDHLLSPYVQYTFGNLKIDAEYRREPRVTATLQPFYKLEAPKIKDMRSMYVAGAYRFTKFLEAGSYHSRYVADWAVLHSDPVNHIYDTAITGRFDLNRYTDLKVEGHFIDGIARSNVSARGFYVAANPTGMQNTTRLLVIRLGLHI
jgi:hypothetical protein